VKALTWRWMSRWLAAPQPEPSRRAERIVAVQLHIVLPAKVGVIAVVLYYLFYSGWLSGPATTQTVVFETLRGFFLVYMLCNAVGTTVLMLWRRFPPELFEWLVFSLGLLDGLFVAGLTLITGGFDSLTFWVFPGLILLNATSIPLATPQIVLNLCLSVFYLGAGILYNNVRAAQQVALMYVPGRSTPRQPAAAHATNLLATTASNEPTNRPHKAIRWDPGPTDQPGEEAATEPFVLRISVLLLLTACCYAMQALLERQRQVEEEARESAVREGQLRSAGRLAAEFAHQIKNPLAIINNAAFSLQKTLRDARPEAAQQIQIIQEEVERSDRIITEIMGYAQLGEGRVEKLSVTEELDRAIAAVFPLAAGYDIEVHREYPPAVPPLLMQRRHLADAFTNVLLNAREAIQSQSNGGGDGGPAGNVWVSARCRNDFSVEVSIRDDGPGIPKEKQEQVFEAYFTTKEKGTGLGLATAKHNVELYGGSVRVESELGKGARFVLLLPARTLIKLEKT
jgi:signal transduction histidine kinase